MGHSTALTAGVGGFGVTTGGGGGAATTGAARAAGRVPPHLRQLDLDAKTVN
jgi:hypothetical protein